MVAFEYKVVPAPTKGQKARGVKGPQARFANAIELQINALASEGWEYLRSDILPSEERQGLTSTHTVYRSILVFRRAIDGMAEAEDALIANAVETDDADDHMDEALEEDIAEGSDETVDEAAEPEEADTDADADIDDETEKNPA